MESGVKYVTVSIPKAIADNVDFLIEKLGYWPSRSSFVREACLEKIRVEMRRISELEEASGRTGYVFVRSSPRRPERDEPE